VWNDLLPGIVSVGISVCVFLYAWVADIHRNQQLETMEPPQLAHLPCEAEIKIHEIHVAIRQNVHRQHTAAGR
jgi:hypothetical protein